MAGSFFAELGLARPDHSLDAGGGSHAEQTAAVLVGLEPILRRESPAAVVVFGDTNSTLAAALTATKLGLPVAHVEAGLRSFDRRMPEELNRIVVDHLATWLFAPTPTAVENLRAEGLARGVVLVGDVMQDLASRISSSVRDPAPLRPISRSLQAFAPGVSLTPGRYLFATLHRAENREPAAIVAWSALLGHVARDDRPVILALHPGTRRALEVTGASMGPHVVIADPLGYRDSMALQLHAAAVLTDSGGVQREAAWLGTPCLVLRDTTEWLEAVADSGGKMRVTGLDMARATAFLARWAPAERSAALAAQRSRELDLRPAGAAAAIARALETRPPAERSAIAGAGGS